MEKKQISISSSSFEFFFDKKNNTVDHIENRKKKKSLQPPDRLTRPVHRFFPIFSVLAVFFSDSLAVRFSALTGPDAGPIPGSTGPVLTILHLTLIPIL
jgi:hypothetical protein